MAAPLRNSAKLILYEAPVGGELEAPRSPLSEVHCLYFHLEYPEFAARTMWSLSNAFTSAFKKLDPVPQFNATAKLGSFCLAYPVKQGPPGPQEPIAHVVSFSSLRAEPFSWLLLANLFAGTD